MSNCLRKRVALGFVGIAVLALVPALVSPLGASTVSWIETAKLVADDAAPGDAFGYEVARDGDTLVVGAFGDDYSHDFSGAVYVFTRSGDVWVQQQKLVPTPRVPGARFGIWVAVDGDLLVAGADSDTPNGYRSGAAYVFSRTDGVWSQQARLIPSDGASGDWSGWNVAIQDETVFIGAPRKGAGAVYIFAPDPVDGAWVEQQKLVASDGTSGDLFGLLAVDGDALVVGAQFDDENGPYSGSAYVFRKNQETNQWIEEAELTAPDAAATGDRFGHKVSIDADTVAISALEDSGAAYGVPHGTGYVYVFVREGSAWVPQQKLRASDGAPLDYFGIRHRIEGDRLLIGAYLAGDAGAAYIFERQDGAWTEVHKLTPSDPADHLFGSAIDLSSDLLVVSAAVGPVSPTGAHGGGVVYLFEPTDSSTCIYQPGPETVDDASINKYVPSRDVNVPDQLHVFTSDGLHGRMRGVIRFTDLSSLPYPASAVALQVHGVPRDPNTPKLGDVSAHIVLEDWDEMTVTYNNQPGHDPVAIDTVSPDTERWYEWDITTPYNDWRSGAAGNFGLKLINSHEDHPATGIITRGSDDPAVDLRPRLLFADGCDPADNDGDGVSDDVDNCLEVANADQADADGDGQGDVCDACPADPENDADGDGLCADVDNCPTTPNSDQVDGDGDGQGDVCDACPADPDNDADGDGLCADADNCPVTPNPGQEDVDGDGLGDACDACRADPENDIDGDGVCGDVDNCPYDANGGQEDNEPDGLGDVCDDDDDNDTVLDVDDNCPFAANLDQADNEDDGAGDVCDTDDDDDGVLDASDNCPLLANADQADNEADGAGDACDDDDDNDTVPDVEDNCQFAANEDQADLDIDGQGNVCDGDDDGDGIDDGADNCPLAPNPLQEDLDEDGAGDACDDDDDGDGVPDAVDNCPTVVNAGQEDHEGDGIGDPCDADDDGDGIDDDIDNCPLTANPAQDDSEGDGIGDVCDPDDDNDTVPDGADNCPFAYNPGQQNLDGDGAGDACDPDDDNDGALDEADNCPVEANPDQEDTDGDHLGDVCDPDDDNDGVFDAPDNCPLISNPEQIDTDLDGLGDVCDADLDGDGVANETDNCPFVANPGQTNTDGDGLGDACDPDDDNDGVADGEDNCRLTPNPGQADTDGDGAGNACDPDDDNDGVDDGADNCPLVANSNQADWDADGFGDACDPDVDGDGVANGDDVCEFTLVGIVVDPDSGCSIFQLCPCDGPRGTNQPWKNHGKYVSCVAHTANSFVDLGLITGEEHGEIVSAAAESDCGKKK